MTDFRHVCSLRAYSGGTVRDLHPILYSPPDPAGIRTAPKPNIRLSLFYPLLSKKSTVLRVLKSVGSDMSPP